MLVPLDGQAGTSRDTAQTLGGNGLAQKREPNSEVESLQSLKYSPMPSELRFFRSD